MPRFAGLVRPLTVSDRAAWAPLWQGYLTFYEADLPADVTALTFGRLLDSAGPMFARVAEHEGALIGLAHCVVHLSTWARGPYVYLNDLFVSPAARGLGAGEALIEAVYAEADARGAARVYGLTHESNATARALYDRVARNRGFIQYLR